MIEVHGWVLVKLPVALVGDDLVYKIRSASVSGHPKFGTTWNYQSTEVVELGEDENGVYADVQSGKRVYLREHINDV